MQKGVVWGILLVLASTSAYAFADATQVYAEVNDGLFEAHASLDPGNEDNLKVTWTIPELDFRYRVGPYEDDRERGISIATPLDAPAGDYLVRITIANDDGKNVVYRYVTIE